MKRKYVIKMPSGGYEVQEYDGKATNAIIVRSSPSRSWVVYGIYPSAADAARVIPTRQSFYKGGVTSEKWEEVKICYVEGYIKNDD